MGGGRVPSPGLQGHMGPGRALTVPQQGTKRHAFQKQFLARVGGDPSILARYSEASGVKQKEAPCSAAAYPFALPQPQIHDGGVLRADTAEPYWVLLAPQTT